MPPAPSVSGSAAGQSVPAALSVDGQHPVEAVMDIVNLETAFNMVVGKYSPCESVNKRWQRTDGSDTPITGAVLNKLVMHGPQGYIIRDGVRLYLYPKFKAPQHGQCPFDLSVTLLKRCLRHNDRGEDFGETEMGDGAARDGVIGETRSVPCFRRPRPAEDWLKDLDRDRYEPFDHGFLLGGATLITGTDTTIQERGLADEEQLALCVQDGFPNCLEADPLSPDDIFEHLVDVLNRGGASSGFNIRPLYRFTEKCDDSWKARMNAESWTYESFKGEALGHNATRWGHLTDVFGSTMKFDKQTHYELMHSFMYQAKVGVGFHNQLMDHLRTVNHRDVLFRQNAYIENSSALQKAILTAYPKMGNPWKRIIIMEHLKVMLPSHRDPIAEFLWPEKSMDEITYFVKLRVKYKSAATGTADIADSDAVEPPNKKGRKSRSETAASAAADPRAPPSDARDMLIWDAVIDFMMTALKPLTDRKIDVFDACGELIAQGVAMIIKLGTTSTSRTTSSTSAVLLVLLVLLVSLSLVVRPQDPACCAAVLLG